MFRKYLIAIISAILITAGVSIPQPILDKVIDFVVPSATAETSDRYSSSMMIKCGTECYCFPRNASSVGAYRTPSPLYRVERPAVDSTAEISSGTAGDDGVTLHHAPFKGVK